MAGFGGILTGLGTGLGGFMEGYERSRKAAEESQRNQEILQEAREQRQARTQAGIGLRGALASGGLENLGTGAAPPAPANDLSGLANLGGGAPGAGGQPQQYAPPPADSPLQSGDLAPGFARDPSGGLTRNGQPPDIYLVVCNRLAALCRHGRMGQRDPPLPKIRPRYVSGWRSGVEAARVLRTISNPGPPECSIDSVDAGST